MAHQSKKTCDNCLYLYSCKPDDPEKEGCKGWKSCFPPPPPPTVPRPSTGSEERKVLIVKVRGRYSEDDMQKLRDKVFKQAETGLIVLDERYDVYEVPDFSGIDEQE